MKVEEHSPSCHEHGGYACTCGATDRNQIAKLKAELKEVSKHASEAEELLRDWIRHHFDDGTDETLIVKEEDIVEEVLMFLRDVDKKRRKLKHG